MLKGDFVGFANWKWKEREVLNPAPQPLSETMAPNHGPQPLTLTMVPNHCPEPSPRSTVPNRRPKRVPVARLYPVKPSPAEAHARAFLAFLQEMCMEDAGKFVPVPDLKKSYQSFAAKEGWEPVTWTALARQLGKITAKRAPKINGKRRTAYRIPRAN